MHTYGGAALGTYANNGAVGGSVLYDLSGLIVFNCYLKWNFKALNVVYMISIHKSVSPVQIFPLNFTHVFTCSLSVALTNYYKLGGIKLKFTLSQFRRPET